jgi:O-antigen ligase
VLHRIASFFAFPQQHPQSGLLRVFVLVTVASILSAIALEERVLMALPGILLVLWVAAVDFRKVYFLLIASIPLSTELELGSFGTDLPSEPLMWLLTLCGIGWFLKNWRTVDVQVLRHPVTLALLAHLAWIAVSTVTSQDLFVSVKFLLAKGWYVAVFYFMTLHMLREERDFKLFFRWFFGPLAFTVCWVLIRHAALGFSFKDVAYAMGPFYRNHVAYACILAVFMPFVWYAAYRYKKYSITWWALATGIVLLLIAINFAYTRAAYVALFAAVGLYWFIRKKILKWGLAAAALGAVLFLGTVGRGDNWLEFAPDYERTVSHTRFDNLLQATTKLEDISTMERVYRWVAASYMIRDKPVTGFGPGNFYFYYQKYTVSSFKTYVSRNPEKSGIHNYYLMTAVEQGLPGLLFFLLFCLIVMLKGEQIYHQTADPTYRRVLTAALLSFILIDLLMLMNDLVETDKIGSLFFISVAIMVNIDLRNHFLSAVDKT